MIFRYLSPLFFDHHLLGGNTLTPRANSPYNKNVELRAFQRRTIVP